MARGRMLSKSLSTSVKRARLHPKLRDLAEFAQALYPLLIAHADDFGREAGDVFTVKHSIDPSSPRSIEDFDRTLQALHDVGLIVWFEAQGRRVIEIVEFDEHQGGLQKRTASRFGAPPHQTHAALDHSERDIEAMIADALSDGSLRIGDLTVTHVERQVRIENSYIDILATTDGPKLVIEIKRQRVSRAAIEQVQGYVARVPDAVPVVIGNGLAANFPLDTCGALVGVYGDDLLVTTAVSFNVMERSLTFSHVIPTRARAELNRTELNRTKERKNAPAALKSPARPVEKPKIPTLAAMVKVDLLPLGITDEGDLIEAAKRRAAQLKLKYTGSAIRRAIASANGQARKRVRA